eukprot:scaffold397_cov152-Isochrysis_galbana.AAC.1
MGWKGGWVGGGGGFELGEGWGGGCWGPIQSRLSRRGDMMQGAESPQLLVKPSAETSREPPSGGRAFPGLRTDSNADWGISLVPPAAQYPLTYTRTFIWFSASFHSFIAGRVQVVAARLLACSSSAGGGNG